MFSNCPLQNPKDLLGLERSDQFILPILPKDAHVVLIIRFDDITNRDFDETKDSDKTSIVKL